MSGTGALRLITEEATAATEELLDRALADGGPADVLVVADWDFPRDVEETPPPHEAEESALVRWCHVITRHDLAHAVAGRLPGAERVRPTRAGHARYFVRGDAQSVACQLR